MSRATVESRADRRDPRRTPLRVFVDFDGTLVQPNVAILLVERFAPNGRRVAREVDEQLHQGRITLRQAWDRQAALLPWDQIPAMTEYVVRHVRLRGGAHPFVDLLREHRVPTMIVSGGLDFYIRPILEREGIDLEFRSDTAHRGEDGRIRVTHPYGHAECRRCGICKAQLVHPPEVADPRTVFIGDGSTDRFAAEVADLVFARGRLLAYCREHGIRSYPFEGFTPVTRRLRRWLIGEERWPARRARGIADSPCPISQRLRTVGA